MADDRLTATVRRLMPLCATLGMDVDEMTPECVVMGVDWRDGLCTANGMIHGGLVMALADSAGAACASVNLPEGAAGTSTIESKSNFLGAARDGRIVATSRPLHIGSTTIVVETEVTNGDRLIAKVTQTQIVLRPRS